MTEKQTNILDPIHEVLDPRVFLDPAADQPQLRPELIHWLTHTIYEVLERYGYDHPDRWLTGVFTGSLCTYQYSDRSDADLNLFVDAERLPDWSRAELAAIVVKNIDPLKLPGTPYQMQTFIQPPGITIKDHFRPGLHAGFIVFGQGAGQWASPPEREAAHDVERERNDAYLAGLMAADKLDLLLRYEPDEAKTFWHQLHSKRREDMQHDMGDFATSNVVYKMIVNRFGEDPVARLSKLASEVPDHFPQDWDDEYQEERGPILPWSVFTEKLREMPYEQAASDAERLAREMTDDHGEWTEFFVQLLKNKLLGRCTRCGGIHDVVANTGTFADGGKPGTIGGMPADLCAYCRKDEERPPPSKALTRLIESEHGHPVIFDTTYKGSVGVEDQRKHSDYDPCAACGESRSSHRYAEYEKRQLNELHDRQDYDYSGSGWMPTALNHKVHQLHKENPDADLTKLYNEHGIRYHPFEDSGQRPDPYTERHQFDRPSFEAAVQAGGGRLQAQGQDWSLAHNDGIYHFQPISLMSNGEQNPYGDTGFKVPAEDVQTALRSKPEPPNPWPGGSYIT